MLGAGVARVGGIAVASLQYTFYLFIAWSTNSTSQPLPLSSCKLVTIKRFCPKPSPPFMSHEFKSETKDHQRPEIETHVTVIDVHCRACWMFQLAHQTSSRSLQMLESPLWQTMYNSICPLHKSIIAIENLLNSWLRKGPKSQQNRRHQEMLCFQNFNLRVLCWNCFSPDSLSGNVIHPSNRILSAVNTFYKHQGALRQGTLNMFRGTRGSVKRSLIN